MAFLPSSAFAIEKNFTSNIKSSGAGICTTPLSGGGVASYCCHTMRGTHSNSGAVSTQADDLDSCGLDDTCVSPQGTVVVLTLSNGDRVDGCQWADEFLSTILSTIFLL